jgi:D-beta-D-heptose 7-phosphate kinase/D-beta-D-heptose 1-phosphate adenosyltransferase
MNIVIGDVMLDINQICNTTRMAPELNTIPVYNVIETKYILGAASNVAKILNSLNCNVELISLIGNDNNGNIIKTKLFDYNIKHKLFNDDRKTTTKNRIFCNNQLVSRFDIEDTQDISDELADNIFEYIKSFKNIKSIIISDYDKGLITDKLCKDLISYANNNNILTFIDPKLKNCFKYKDCFCFKPNLSEAIHITKKNDIDEILHNINNIINCKNVILTCGKNGMYLNKIQYHFYNETTDVIDVTGAGDVAISVIFFVFLNTQDLMLACEVANYICSKSVATIGNYNVTTKDIDKFYENNNNSYKIIHCDNIEKIRHLSNINNIVFTNGCFDIIHSAHIKLLQFSKKQGDILVLGLNSDESIKRLKGEKRPINNIQERTELLKQFDFIDYIIIFEEDTPLNILKNLKPTTLVKGGDYTIDNIIGKEYAKNIILFNYFNNISSSITINKIKNT